MMKRRHTFGGPGLFLMVLWLSVSLSGCDYWPPATLAQLEQLRATVQDLSDERAQLEAQLREATLLREELQGRLNETARENEALKKKLARLDRGSADRRGPRAVHARPSTKQSAARAPARSVGQRVLHFMKPLMRGKDVKAVQAALKKIGLPVDVDGYYGSGTSAAVRWLQRKHGLASDGVVGPKTRSLIERKAAQVEMRVIHLKRPHMQGSDIKLLQRALRDKGVRVQVDGTFGERTQKAVKRFQRKQGLRADGVVGPATLRALGLS